jgi:hypothetical protein
MREVSMATRPALFFVDPGPWRRLKHRVLARCTRATDDPFVRTNLRGKRVPAWRAMPLVWLRHPHVPSMLTLEEMQLLYWLARDWYTGRGTLVDCGAWLGGSTSALCAGLADNPRVARKDGAVHAFDRFLYEPYFADWFGQLGEELADGDCFLHIFRRLTAPYRRFLTTHPGDVCVTPYDGGDVEVLFLDVCKSWEINAAVVGRFFRHLVPGRSIVVQQDYAHHFAYWLVLTMDHFRDYFEDRGRVGDGHSAVFRYVDKIPAHRLDVDLRTLPLRQKRDAFEREILRAEGWQRVEFLVGYARLLYDVGDVRGARAAVARIDPHFHDHPVSKLGLDFLPRAVAAAVPPPPRERLAA